MPVFFKRWRKGWSAEGLGPDSFLGFEGGLRFVAAHR